LLGASLARGIGDWIAGRRLCGLLLRRRGERRDAEKG
jgi:hypothetical protein